MVDRREALDRQGDLPWERALADLIEDGAINRHARKARRTYPRFESAHLLASQLAEKAEFTHPAGAFLPAA